MKKLLFILLSGLLITSCTEPQQQKSDSGVKKATTIVKTNPNGQTVE